MIRIHWLSAGALVAVALAGPANAEAPAPAIKSVLELFTSQGCSSCPPADVLLSQLSKNPDIVTLSYSVDYWNYLGWHDTLSSAANSERQRDYARMRGDGQVYTPQIVVDGLTHVNGANEAAIEMAMRSAAERLEAVKVPVNIQAEGDTLVVGVGAAPSTSDERAATVWLAVAKKDVTVPVTRGENRGRTLSYHHPVRKLTPIGMWKGEPMTIRLPLKELKTGGGDSLVALVQVENAGPILGAAEHDQ